MTGTNSANSVDAIILAGGFGTRLQAVVSDVPKPLAPVNGRPFLDIILSQLDRFESVRKVVLAIGHKADAVQARYENVRHHHFDIGFSVEPKPLGTGGAIGKALPLTASRDVLVLNGDSYVEFDLRDLTATHAGNGASVTMVVVEMQNTARFGSVKLDESGKKVVGFAEKSGSEGHGFINAGCYLLARSAFDGLPPEASSFEKDILPQYLASTYAQVVTGKFIDIGVPESYLLADEYLR